MTILYELLFRAWCPAYDPKMLPEHLKGDPVTGYGQYAFEKGFKLGAELALSLDYEEMAGM